jgi:hypothetical protein
MMKAELLEAGFPRIGIQLLVRAECMRCPWLLAETKVATILGKLFLLSYLTTGIQNTRSVLKFLKFFFEGYSADRCADFFFASVDGGLSGRV